MAQNPERPARRLGAAVLPLFFLLPACRDGVSAPGRSLLTAGGVQVRPAGGAGPVELPPGPFRLAGGERAILHVEVASAPVLELGLSGGPGSLDLAVGTFPPLNGETDVFDLWKSLSVGQGTSLLGVELPDPGGQVLALALDWTASVEGAELRVERLILREPDPPPRPPIIFLSIDTFSARHASLYGYARPTTPALQRFAQDAVTFEEALANATFTTPSYVSQLSGLLPGACRVSPGDWRWVIPEDRWTLAEMLRARGYRSAAFVDNLNVDERFGLAQGFEVFDTSAAHVTITDSEGGIRNVLPRAEAWIDAVDRESQPFFLFLQVVDLHGPYDAPGEHAGAFAPDDGDMESRHTLPIEKPTAEGFSPPFVAGAVPQYIAAGANELLASEGRMYTAPLVAAYDGEIAALDESVGAFLDRLRARGLYDRAIIVISADHGETMLEHDVYFRHTHNYQENLHVPLVIRLPGGEGAGRTVPGPVQLVDLYPTLAELVGLEAGTRSLHGRSLVPLLRGERRAAKPVLSETGSGDSDSIVWQGWKLIETYPQRMNLEGRLSHHRTRRWLAERYPELRDVVFGTFGWDSAAALDDPQAAFNAALEFTSNPEPYHELYDLRADPGETVNLAEAQPERVAELLVLLERERGRARRARALVPHEELPVRRPRSPEEVAELRKLGYTGD